VLQRSAALAGSLHPHQIARGEYHGCVLTQKTMNDGLADAHRGARYHDDFARIAHAELLLAHRAKVKQAYALAKIFCATWS